MAAGKQGPARKPALQVVREGNPGKRPIRREIQPPPSSPNEPKWDAVYPDGEEDGRAEFLRAACRRRFAHYVATLDPQGLLTANDPDIFTELVRLLAELDWEIACISREGSLIEGRRDGKVRNPRWMTVSALRSELKPMIGLFGLAPGARLEGRRDEEGSALFDG